MFVIKENHLSAVLIAILFTVVCCSPKYTKSKEAREDAEKMAQSLRDQAAIPNSMTADAETAPAIAANVDVDAADDPAIWYNTEMPEKTTIVGTNKRYGYHVYDLAGSELQSLAVGKINNADIRTVKDCNGQSIDVLAGSNRSDRSIDIHQMTSFGQIGAALLKISLGKFDPYGFALYQEGAKWYALVNDKNGEVRQYHVYCDNNVWKSDLARTLKLASQVEGMVADDVNQVLYVGEEEKAVFAFEASAMGDTKAMQLPETTSDIPNIKYDIEGIALLPPHYLLISSQGNFSYAIYDLRDQTYVTSFTIVDGVVDGVEETDGLEVCARPMGSKYPEGVLVVQDGFNFDNGTKKNQNFKIIDLRKVNALLPKN